jgi:hypothetical protein
MTVLICSFLFQAGQIPPVLQQSMMARRESFASAFEWSYQRATDASPYRYSTRFAGQDHLEVLLGDAEGLTVPAENAGAPGSYSEKRRLYQDGVTWSYKEGFPNGHISLGKRRLFDPRLVGYLPERGDLEDIAAHAYLDVLTFEVVRNGNAVEVRGSMSNADSSGTTELIWILEVDKGLNPVSVRKLVDGEVTREARSRYRNWDGIWFPETVEYFRDGAFYARYEFLTARFDTEYLPLQLDPVMLNIPPRVNLSTPEKDIRIWDGSRAIDLADYLEREHEIDSTDWEALLELAKVGRQGTQPKSYRGEFLGLSGVAHEPLLWEEYVRRFVRRHGMQPQRERVAWEVHRECLKLARRIRAKTADAEPASEDESVRQEWERRVHQQIQRVFDEVLLPGLQKLVPNTG